MEDIRQIKRVGNYSMSQAKPEDCIVCHNAKYATVLIDGVCLDCVLKELQHYKSTTLGLWCTDRPDKIPKEIKHLFFKLEPK